MTSFRMPTSMLQVCYVRKTVTRFIFTSMWIKLPSKCCRYLRCSTTKWKKSLGQQRARPFLANCCVRLKNLHALHPDNKWLLQRRRFLQSMTQPQLLHRDSSIGNLIHIIPVISEPSGRYRAGRPCLKFDTTWLADVVSPSRHIPKQTLARTLGVHQNTLHRHMKMNGISKEYSPIPNAGLHFITAFLTSHGLRVQQARIQSSMQCINPLGRFVRYSNAIQRCVYESPWSNYVWHIDGHHKLIRWGFIIHGMIDGFCRMVFWFSHSVQFFLMSF